MPKAKKPTKVPAHDVPKAKKAGKVPANDVAQQRQALKAIGLRIKKIEEDGNCLFRAIADQLWGDQERHEELRQKTVDYIDSNRAHFECFCEEDEPIDDYCARMRKAGEWGGNMEVVAASGYFKVGIAIHQADTPCYVVSQEDARSGGQGGGRKTLHLSLHDGDSDGLAHYNSVRMISEGDEGPSRVGVGGSLERTDTTGAEPADVAAVIRGSGCADEARAKEMLAACDGDVDAAIEALIAGCELEPHGDEGDGCPGGHRQASDGDGPAGSRSGDGARAGEDAATDPITGLCIAHLTVGTLRSSTVATVSTLKAHIQRLLKWPDSKVAGMSRDELIEQYLEAIQDGGADAGERGEPDRLQEDGAAAQGKTKLQQKREAKAAKAAAKRAEKKERVLSRENPSVPHTEDARPGSTGAQVLANGIRVLAI